MHFTPTCSSLIVRLQAAPVHFRATYRRSLDCIVEIETRINMPADWQSPSSVSTKQRLGDGSEFGPFRPNSRYLVRFGRLIHPWLMPLRRAFSPSRSSRLRRWARLRRRFLHEPGRGRADQHRRRTQSWHQRSGRQIILSVRPVPAHSRVQVYY